MQWNLYITDSFGPTFTVQCPLFGGVRCSEVSITGISISVEKIRTSWGMNLVTVRCLKVSVSRGYAVLTLILTVTQILEDQYNQSKKSTYLITVVKDDDILVFNDGKQHDSTKFATNVGGHVGKRLEEKQDEIEKRTMFRVMIMNINAF